MKLAPKDKLRSIKAGAIQLWAPYALEMAIAGEVPPLTPGQQKVLSKRFHLLHLAGTSDSWNHQQMLWCLALWLGDELDYTSDWWESYLKYQLGDLSTPRFPGAYLSQWGGSESNSAGYEHMRWGCVCAVDLWARKLKMGNGEHNVLAALCRRYHRTQVAMCRLLPTAVGERSGEHSKPLHLEMWKLAEGRQTKRRWPREIDWPMRLLQQVMPIPLPVGHVEDLARPLFSEIRCAQWGGGTHAYWLVERRNFNTPCYLIEIQRASAQAELVYPWRKGRGFGDKRDGGVTLEDGHLMWNVPGGPGGIVELPSGPPSRCYAIGQSGYVEGDWAAWLRGE